MDLDLPSIPPPLHLSLPSLHPSISPSQFFPFLERYLPIICSNCTNMKTITLLLTFFAFSFISCEKIDKLTQFTINDQFETTIKAGLATLAPTDMETPPVTSIAEKELTMNNSRIDMIESVKLEELKMVIFDPTGRTFDFLKDIEIFIAADGLPEKKIASANNLADDVTNTIRLTTENVELEQYLKKGTYTIRMRVTTDKIINQDIKVRSTAKFFVDAKVLGL